MKTSSLRSTCRTDHTDRTVRMVPTDLMVPTARMVRTDHTDRTDRMVRTGLTARTDPGSF